MHELSHGAFRAAAHRSAVLDRQGQYRRDMHALSRADRKRAPPGDSRRIMGKAAAPDSGLRGLPRAAQGTRGVLSARDVGPGLPALPRRPEPEDRPGWPDRLAVRGPERTGALAARAHGVHTVPHRRDACGPAALPVDPGQGGLLDLPRGSNEPVPRKHARQTGGAGEPGCARLPGLPRLAWHSRKERLGLADVFAQRAGAVRKVPPDGAEGRAALQRDATRRGRTLPGEHSRKGADRKRADGDRRLRRLPYRASRTARERPALERQPRATRARASTAPTSPAPARSATAAS